MTFIKTYIYFDVDGRDNGDNCMASLANDSSCKNPDTFGVRVTAKGQVLLIEEDYKGRVFLKNRIFFG